MLLDVVEELVLLDVLVHSNIISSTINGGSVVLDELVVLEDVELEVVEELVLLEEDKLKLCDELELEVEELEDEDDIE